MMKGDMDMMGGKGGMMMMRGMMPIIAMLAIEAVGSGLQLFRWTAADKYNGYTTAVGTTNWWMIANAVSGYGNLVLSVSALLLGAISQIVDEPMLMEAMGLSIKLGMAVFAIENMLRMYAYDRANTVANDGATSPANAAIATDIQSSLKMEMAMSTAHEAMTRLTLMKAKEGMDKKGGRKGDKDDSDSDSAESDSEGESSDEGLTSNDGEGGSGDGDDDDGPALF